jgi:hypothetical protein
MVIHTLIPSGRMTPNRITRSMNHGKSEYSRPELMPAHRTVRPSDRPKFQMKQFHTPSFSDHSFVLPSAGVMYIMAMANAIEIQPKMTAITWTWRM